LSDNYLFFFERNTDAVATNRGFYYQYLKTLEIWIECYVDKKDIKIFCENEEDIKLDQVSSLVFKQIKCYKSSFSLSSIEIKKAIVNFYYLFRKHEASNPEFVFESNSTIKENEQLLAKWNNNQNFISDEILLEIKKNVEEILIEHAQNILNSEIAAFAKKISELENKSYPKNIKFETNRLIEIESFKTHIEVCNQNFKKEKTEIQKRAKDFIKTIRWKFDNINPEQAIIKIENECTDVIKKIENLKQIPKIIFDRLLSEIIRKSQSKEINQRILNIDIFSKIIKESDEEINRNIDVKIINGFEDVKKEIEKLKVDLKDLSQKVEGKYEYENKSKIPIAEIIKKFENASYFLAEYRDDFNGVSNSHIIRSETVQLKNWIDLPIEQDKLPIALLVGNAGMGKSVILKDLLKDLQKQKIPVIGLKSDRTYAKSIIELEKKVPLGESFEKTILAVRDHFDQVVILIDQLDALSQSLSANREFLDTYNLLIHSLSKISGVRIIISVRTYDLNYDVDLHVYKNQKIINVKLLEIDQVKSIFQKLGLNSNNVSAKLIELLRVPLNLDIFCSIYKSSLNLGSIKTLQDLYNEFWKQKIINPQNPNGKTLNCKKAVQAIADNIDSVSRDNINTTNLFEKFTSEFQYLKSNNILTGKEPEIHFFHQTFFDYVFAKQFIDSKKSILAYIQEKEQGLFIRSRIKMIISFLKETDKNEYIRVLSKIIFSNKLRFHIKLLLINTLGFENNLIEEEKKFVKSKILSNNKFKIIFLESVFSPAWYKFLADEKYIEKFLIVKENRLDRIFRSSLIKKVKIETFFKSKISYIPFEERKELLQNICFKIVLNQFEYDRNFALELIEKLPDFENKPRFIIRLLYFLKIWDNPIAFNLFEKFSIEVEKDRFQYYKIIEDAASFNIDWVFDKFRYVINLKLDLVKSVNDKPNIEFEDTQLLEKLIKIDPVKTFVFCLDIIKSLVEKTSTQIDDKSLYIDLTYWFFDYDRSSIFHGYYDKVLQILIDITNSLSKQQNSTYLQFVQQHLNCNSQTLLCVLIHGFISNPNQQINQIFNFILIFNKKNGFNENSGKVHFFMRKLLYVAYPIFSQEQKDVVNNILLAITAKWETEIFFDEKLNQQALRKSYGYTKYLYLKSIPISEINAQPLLKKVFQELDRKPFARNFCDSEPNKFRSMGVPPPLSQKTYKRMKCSDWEKSFVKFNTDKTFWENGSIKGSMLEHSRAFQKEVSERPDYFYLFIEKLIDDNIVPHDYILKGLEGLKEAKYDADKIKQLYKKVIFFPLSDENTLYMVWLSDCFIKNIDFDIANFLCNLALTHKDPETNTDPDSQSLNSVRGAATCRIIEMNSPVFADLIFSTLGKIIEKEKIIGVKISIALHLALLLNINKEKTLNLFLNLVKTKEIGVYKNAIWSISYFAKEFFVELIPFFQSACDIDDETTLIGISEILAVSWLENKEESLNLLKPILIKNTKAKSAVINIAITNMFDVNAEVRNKCHLLYKMFLNETSDDVIHAYSITFHHISLDNFFDVYPLLKMYSKSRIAKKSPHYFFEYVLKCIKNHPQECLDLVSLYDSYDKPNIIKSDPYNDYPIKIVIGVYNELRNSNKNYKKELNNCMVLFDKMLQDYRYRNSAIKIMNDVDS